MLRFIKNGDTVLIYCGTNLCGLLLLLVRKLYKEPFATFIKICQQQGQDIELHVGEKVTSLLAELQGNLSQQVGGTVT